MSLQNVQIGRLAMRAEGDNWNAYYAPLGTMKGAIFLGSIKMRFVQDSKRRKDFMGIMKDAVADIVEEKIGTRPTWENEKPAPDSERSGHG